MGVNSIKWLGICALTFALCACTEDGDGERTGSGLRSSGDGDSGGGSGSGGGDGDSGGGDGDGVGVFDGEGCAKADVNAERIKPIVWFVVDGSGSMRDDLGGVSRWSALRSALMDPDGVVDSLQSVVEFGMVLYNGPGGSIGGIFGGGAACPQIIIVPASLDNYGAINAAYPAEQLGGSTPTHYGIEAARMQIMIPPASPDIVPGPAYIILATDGAPNDMCENSSASFASGLDAETYVIDQTGLALSEDIKTFVISLAGGDVDLLGHLTDVTTAGGTGTTPFEPATKQDLVDTLANIVGGAIGCEIVLDGTVTEGMECLGFVDLNGTRLGCDDPDGWRLISENTIELTGKACDDLMADDSLLLHADFPCDVFKPE